MPKEPFLVAATSGGLGLADCELAVVTIESTTDRRTQAADKNAIQIGRLSPLV